MRELTQSFVNCKSLINSNNIWNNQYIFVGDLLGGKNDDPPVLVCVVILCLPGRRSACCGIRYYLHATIIRTHLDYSCRHQCNSECLSTCCCLFQFFHPLDSKEYLYIWCSNFVHKLLSAHFEIKMSVVRKTTSGFVPKSPKESPKNGVFRYFFLYIA